MMFSNNVPEKIIQNTTGHRTLESFRMYEKTSLQQHQAVSKILTGVTTTKENIGSSYNQELNKIIQGESSHTKTCRLDDAGDVTRSVFSN